MTSLPSHSPNPAPPSIRVLIADDHLVVREGLAAILEAADDMTLVGEAADGAERSHGPSFEGRAVGLARVLDHRQPAPGRHLQDGSHVRRLPVQVHGEDRARSGAEGRLDLPWIQRHPLVDVHEDGARAGLADRRRRGDRSRRDGDHLVLGPDAVGEEGYYERRRPRGGGDGLPHAAHLGEGLLKLTDAGPLGQLPRFQGR